MYIHTVDHWDSLMVSPAHDNIQQPPPLSPLPHGGVYVTSLEPVACNGVVIIGSENDSYICISLK